MIERPWIVIGGGGHAGVVIDVLRVLGCTVMGFVDLLENSPAGRFGRRLGSDDAVYDHDKKNVVLANGLGSTGKTDRRKEMYLKLHSSGYEFGTIVHPFTNLARSVSLGIGCQIMAGAIVQPHCVLGDNVIINTSASIDHDCVIGDHVHVAPGAILSGGVVVNNNVHIGTGAVIKQGVVLGANSLIAAGALVLSDVPSDTVVMGVPAVARK